MVTNNVNITFRTLSALSPHCTIAKCITLKHEMYERAKCSMSQIFADFT